MRLLRWLVFVDCWLFVSPVFSQVTPENIELKPEIIESSPVLGDWLQEIPNVLEDIENDPSFRTRFRLGYSFFPSRDNASGITLGISDIFIEQTKLTLSADYTTSFTSDRATVGTDLRYYLLPLGKYVNVAPVLGYRYLQSDDYETDGINLGLTFMVSLSRSGAADLAFTQSFVSPGSNNEVGISTLALGYAVTENLRLATEFQQQNSRQDHDTRWSIMVELTR